MVFYTFAMHSEYFDSWVLLLIYTTLFLVSATFLLLLTRNLSGLVRKNSTPMVLCTARSEEHKFTKRSVPSIKLIKGLGIEGDCHMGETDQHLWRRHLGNPNLRQVHLIQNEILRQYEVAPAEIGENITTEGIDLLKLGRGTKLLFVNGGSSDVDALDEEHAVVNVTGLRNPCPQIEKHRKGLQAKFIERGPDRKIVARKAGIMSTVEVAGEVTPGMRIIIERPEKHEDLDVV